VPKEESLADHIRAAAKESGMSVYQIAKETGLDQSALNRFLNGTRDNVRLDVANRLFEFFELRVVRPRRRKK
jgi:transcriptional regulator with XRE-family HTH domain